MFIKTKLIFCTMLCFAFFGLTACAKQPEPDLKKIPPVVKPVTPKKEEEKYEFSKGTPQRSGKSYVTRGVRYYLLANSDGYDETGIGTWYGKKFHGRKTASGEVFDMNAMTAAHKTLPLGTRVKVTNLKNGKSIVVRITDRGPFSKTKIIDLSRRGAELLDFRYAGITKVRVQALK